MKGEMSDKNEGWTMQFSTCLNTRTEPVDICFNNKWPHRWHRWPRSLTPLSKNWNSKDSWPLHHPFYLQLFTSCLAFPLVLFWSPYSWSSCETSTTVHYSLLQLLVFRWTKYFSSFSRNSTNQHKETSLITCQSVIMPVNSESFHSFTSI